jgi:hypothetical protein
MNIKSVVEQVMEILTGRGVQPDQHIHWHEHKDGSVRFTFNHTPLEVILRPDEQVSSVPGRRKAGPAWVDLDYLLHFHHEAGHITSVTPPSLTLTPKFEAPSDPDFIGPPAPPRLLPSNYGRGHNYGDHENSHIADCLQGILEVPPPDHQRLVGQPKEQWTTYQQKWEQWKNNLVQCSEHITDRVPPHSIPGDPGLRDLNEACDFLMRPHSGTPGFSGPSGMPRR